MDPETAARKRARNCAAARRSRQKKRERQDACARVIENLPTEIARMESEYQQLWLACVSPQPLGIAEEADRLRAENYSLRLQLFELIARVSPEVVEMVRQQLFPRPPWEGNDQLVMMGMMAVPPVGQQHLPWQQDGLQHPDVALRAAGIDNGFHQAPAPFQPVPPPMVDPIVIPQPHAVLQPHTNLFLQVSPGSDSQSRFSNTQSSPPSHPPPPHHF